MRAVLFLAGGVRVALPFDAVEEVLALGHLTPVPLGPPALLGATAVRGAILPVVDPGVLLDRPLARAAGGDVGLRIRDAGAAVGDALVYAGPATALRVRNLEPGEAPRGEALAVPVPAPGGGDVLLLDPALIFAEVRGHIARVAREVANG